MLADILDDLVLEPCLSHGDMDLSNLFNKDNSIGRSLQCPPYSSQITKLSASPNDSGTPLEPCSLKEPSFNQPSGNASDSLLAHCLHTHSFKPCRMNQKWYFLFIYFITCPASKVPGMQVMVHFQLQVFSTAKNV